MKWEFVQPRFTGQRFDEHTLPVEVARDLAAYEQLIVDLAKHLFLQEHPDRQRVPKGFVSAFHLDIERVEPGSAMPVLALVASGMLELTGGEQSYFERARDLAAECIAAQPHALPAHFPAHLLVHFNQFGRSLREGEAVELRRSNGTAAVLTPEQRKHLVLAANRCYEREVELFGHITEVDWERPSFRLRLADGTGTQLVIPMPEDFRDNARKCGGRQRDQVCFKGVAAFDSWDRLQKVLATESLEVSRNHPLAVRLDELTQVEAGWHDGAGAALDREGLAKVAEHLVAFYPEHLPIPLMVPTQDGNLLLEWNTPGDPSLDLLLDRRLASFHSFGVDGREIEQDFALDSEDEWARLFSFLGEHVRPLPA